MAAKFKLILGGRPCKGFSRIGRPVIESLPTKASTQWVSKDYWDQRNALLHKYVLFLEALRPDAFVFRERIQLSVPVAQRPMDGWMRRPCLQKPLPTFRAAICTTRLSLR